MQNCETIKNQNLRNIDRILTECEVTATKSQGFKKMIMIFTAVKITFVPLVQFLLHDLIDDISRFLTEASSLQCTY